MDNSKLQRILMLFRVKRHHLSLFIFFLKFCINYALTHLVKLIVMLNIVNCRLININFFLAIFKLGFFVNTIFPLFVFVVLNDIVLLVIFHEHCFSDLSSFLIEVSFRSHFYHYFIFDFVVNSFNDNFGFFRISVFSNFNVGVVIFALETAVRFLTMFTRVRLV